MNASFDLALAAARAAAGMQHYPEAALYVVATPIGNLSDISLRALHVLQLVHAIACEDPRHTQTMLRQYGIDKPLLPVHEHNEAQAAGGVTTSSAPQATRTGIGGGSSASRSALHSSSTAWR